MAALVEKILLASQTTLLSTGLDSLSNNALCTLGAAFDNTIGQTGDGYTLCDVELILASMTAAANSSINVWFIQAHDGTTYEDSTATIARPPDVVIPLRAITGAQRVVVKGIELPPGKFKPIALNNATGAALASSGNTIKIRPYTREYV